MSKNLTSSIVLLVINAVFICIGAVVFSFLENRGIRLYNKRLSELQDTIYAAANMNEYYDNEAEHIIISDLKSNASVACANGKAIPWSYAHSFNFALSILTTVGWGVMSPSNYTCKTVVCFYALIGIPLYGIFIALIKDYLGRAFRFLVRISRDVSWYWVALAINIIFSIFASIMLNIAMDVGREKLTNVLAQYYPKTQQRCVTAKYYYHYHDNVTLFDEVYFGFITVSTVGFGDEYLRIPKCDNRMYESMQVALTGFILFTLLLGMTAHLFDVISENGENSVRHLSKRLTKRFSTSTSSDDDSLPGNDTRTFGR